MSEADTKPAKARDGRRRNNLRHGLRCVSLSAVPRGASYIGKLTHALRRELESAVVEVKGTLSLTDTCLVNTAVRFERHAQLAARWLAKHAETMSHDQRLAFSREVAKASEGRDKAIRELNLDKDAGNILDALYSVRPVTESAEQ